MRAAVCLYMHEFKNWRDSAGAGARGFVLKVMPPDFWMHSKRC